MDPRIRRFALQAALATIVLNAANAMASATEDSFGGRTLLVYAPEKAAPATRPPLVVVLHGGLANAQRIESGQSEQGLNLDAVAERAGFVVAYLNGTPVTRRMGADKLGWNAGGGCCGLSARSRVDDVHYIQGAIGYLADKYGIDRTRVFGFGHSNGAMMAQRMMCESTTFAAIVAVSGPLNFDPGTCPAARGKRILAIHGADDRNVPLAGGRGDGFADTAFNSEARSQQTFRSSGAEYTLEVIPGADHWLGHIDDGVRRNDGISLPEKAARFFGLLDPSAH